MKRKGRKSASKKEELNENGVEDKVDQNGDASEQDAEPEPETKKRKSSSKSSRKSVPAPPKSDSEDEAEADNDENDGEYEVEAVLEEKLIKGVRHYLIRWKGYEPESDTWEPEGTLDCDNLISEFKEKQKKGKKGRPPKKSKAKGKDDDKEPDWDENDDFEVDRILEVHFKKNGKREFLVSWKGYPSTDNSWEPEENMDCKDLIERFMSRVAKAKQVDSRELRTNRAHTERFTLTTKDSGRRVSRRNAGKQRVQYHDAE